jgi:hypothetical protein
MCGLDDTAREENSTVKERLDLGWFDAVLPVLGAVAAIPVELASRSGDAGQPLVKATVCASFTSYSVAIHGRAVKHTQSGVRHATEGPQVRLTDTDGRSDANVGQLAGIAEVIDRRGADAKPDRDFLHGQ